MAGIDPALVIVGLVVAVVFYLIGYFIARSYWYSRGHLDGMEDASNCLMGREKIRRVEYNNVRVREKIEETG